MINMVSYLNSEDEKKKKIETEKVRGRKEQPKKRYYQPTNSLSADKK